MTGDRFTREENPQAAPRRAAGKPARARAAGTTNAARAARAANPEGAVVGGFFAGISVLTVLGVLLLAMGVGALGWMAWQYFGTNITSGQAKAREVKKIKEEWKAPASPAAASSKPIPGNAMALIRIPDLGADYEQPIISGTEEGNLAKGIGWYVQTAQPGQVGNFAVAGHRITHGEPFARLLELNVGAQVVIETQDAIYTYKLTTAPRDLTVDDKDGYWVLDEVPQQPRNEKAKADKPTITLTTCSDLVASPRRSVAFGELIKAEKKEQPK